jgi:hypothetical protein
MNSDSVLYVCLTIFVLASMFQEAITKFLAG